MKKIKNLKLHEEITIDSGSSQDLYCRRVPGGLLYRQYELDDKDWFTTAMCFVPFNDFVNDNDET